MLEAEDEPGEAEGQALQETGIVTETEEQSEGDQGETVTEGGEEETIGVDSEAVSEAEKETACPEFTEEKEETAETEFQQDGDLAEQMVEEEGQETVLDVEATPDEEYSSEIGGGDEVPSNEKEDVMEGDEDSDGGEIDVGTEMVPTVDDTDLVQENTNTETSEYHEEEKIEVQDQEKAENHIEEPNDAPLEEQLEENDLKEGTEENQAMPVQEGNEVDDTDMAGDANVVDCGGEADVDAADEAEPEAEEELEYQNIDADAGEVEEEMDVGKEHYTKDAEEGMEIDETPDASEATDHGLEEGKDIDADDGVNGIAEDDEDMNYYAEELSPEDLFNIAPSEGKELPQCRLKRNYTCAHCGLNTQNPREHLYHLRDEHGERMKVFECPCCIYASKNQQKLIRHARMVHKLKIKRQDSGSSPYKSHSKGSRVKISPSKSSRESVSPGKSSRSSPGKSPRSSESTHDTWEGMDEYEDDDLDIEDSPAKGEDRKMYYCQQCDYSCRSRKLLNRHETSYHLKRRFFRCIKCNYVTHLKGRYTKHMKYHQLPILKCEYCDFRTPYRWNLDRHMKNHVEDCGEYKCHLCNFTAQIKQSLTVHISNHHLTAEQIREREMRRTIGISDPADCLSDDQELELLRMERDEHPDALILPGFGSPTSPGDSSLGHHNGNNSFRVSNIDMGNQDDSLLAADDSRDEDGEPRKKKPKIKITLKKMKMKIPKSKDTFFQELNERHNFEEDFIHPDDVVQRHGNVYIKTFKCHYCSFKAAFKNEISRHEKKIHSIPMPRSEISRKAKKSLKALKSMKLSKGLKHTISSSDDVLSEILRFPQALPDDGDDDKEESAVMDALDEINAAVAMNETKLKEEELSNGESKMDDTSGRNSPETLEQPPGEHSSDSKEMSPSKEHGKKKGQSFFEKLQEKIPTSNVQNLVCQFCGHESKCLSESVRHQKLHLSAKNIYASASLSTRCQFCRHRCKTTDDLITHLKLCPEARKNQITDSGRRLSGTRGDNFEEGDLPDRDEDSKDSNDDNLDDVRDRSGSLSRDQDDEKYDDDKHPMENRVFVWNNIPVQDEAEQNEGGGKIKDEADATKDLKKLSPEALKNSGKSSAKRNDTVLEEGIDYIESPSPQGNHYYSKRVYRCPQCSFWATTASRFHVHIVGHFNKKPYNCSECGYKSNWRWDITKHIKLKTSRDNSHQGAQVIITDETGEKNYEKYDCYLAIIQLDETNAHRTEGGIPTRKGRPKRCTDKDDEKECVAPSLSPVRKPPMVSIPVMPRMQGLPRLTRAPGSRNRPGPMPFGPILPGAQMMVQIAGSSASGSSGSRPPPPLSLRGTPKNPSPSTASTPKIKSDSSRESTESPTAHAQYQIITPQGAVNTNLETLQLLASGSTNISRLKKQQQKRGDDASEEKDRQASITHQMRLLAWLSFLTGGSQQQVSVSSTGEDGREVAKMVLDHEGNPEWKCHTCDFRDSERETVVQHVRLAHARGGPVSLLHAVHRCDVCGYAAGTKRAVQLHIDSSHGGQGGITSRCEGQTPDSKDNSGDSENIEFNETSRIYQCRQCPFISKKRSEMRPHVAYHSPRPDCIFKCMFCPFYVPTKSELFEHLNVHGMEVPASVLEAANKVSSTVITAPEEVGGGSRNLVCDSCPFETRSRAKLMHHRQFHKPKGLPFRCPHCTYNVTRRHLLSQHIRVHGLEPVLDDNMEGTNVTDSNQVDDRSNSPSPSLTITPVNNVAAASDTGDDSTVTDSSLLPKLTDQSTMGLDDIPLVWVSRDNRFFKMFKCRHCPHVNLRKTNIQEHEKMHKTDSARENGGLHCPYCSYVSVNAGVMSAHMKVHAGSMGQCHAVVDPSLSDEDQLRQLTTRASSSRPETPQPIEVPANNTQARKSDEKVIYYCQQCPARFFFEKEIQIHTRFHTTSLPHKCDHCNYGARQQAHLLAHLKVHTPEYQQRTRTMMSQHRTATTHPPVPGLTIPHEAPTDSSGDTGGAEPASGNSRLFSASPPPSSTVPPQPPPTSKYMCDECPASFSKLLTLQYHQSLHGAKNPHTCHRCSYAGKTEENLQQHLLLHSQHDESVQAEKSVKEAPKVTPTPAPSETVTKAPESEKPATSTSTPSSSSSSKSSERDSSHPPIKLKLIGLRPISSENGSGGRPQFKYYVEEQIPLSGVDLLRRKTQMEKEGQDRIAHHESGSSKGVKRSSKEREEVEEDDPKRIGDPKLYYPMHIDKVTGKSREKRYKCNKCPSAFEKTEQYHVHSNLHGSNHKYKCRICDYSVKFYANFMMHINRHKYHERMVSQNGDGPPPEELDPKYEPIINSNDTSQGDKSNKNRTEESNKENLDDVDLTTSERQHLLLQNKKGVKEPASKDEEKERRVYYCQYCPYANVRRDAVDSHSLRHQANGGYGVYKCTFCDYTASQPNFIREHTKVHFRPFKYVHPEGFMRHDRQEILSAAIAPPGSKAVDGPKLLDGKNVNSHEDRYVLFSHDTGIYKPPIISNPGEEEEPDSYIANGIQVNFRSGDIVDAPNDFVISLRPGTKVRNGTGLMDTSDLYPGDGMDMASSSGVQSENAISTGVDAEGSADISTPVEEFTKDVESNEDKTEGMEVNPESEKEVQEDVRHAEGPDEHEPSKETEDGPDTSNKDESALTNGHVDMEVEGDPKDVGGDDECEKMEIVSEAAAETSSGEQLPANKVLMTQPEPLVSSQ